MHNHLSILCAYKVRISKSRPTPLKPVHIVHRPTPPTDTDTYYSRGTLNSTYEGELQRRLPKQKVHAKNNTAKPMLRKFSRIENMNNTTHLKTLKPCGRIDEWLPHGIHRFFAFAIKKLYIVKRIKIISNVDVDFSA